MPLVKIEIIKGQSKEYKTTLLQSVHEGLVNSLSIPNDDRNQRLYELDECFYERSPDKTEKFTLIELTIFPGRSTKMKKDAISEITRLLGARLQIEPLDILLSSINRRLKIGVCAAYKQVKWDCSIRRAIKYERYYHGTVYTISPCGNRF